MGDRTESVSVLRGKVYIQHIPGSGGSLHAGHGAERTLQVE